MTEKQFLDEAVALAYENVERGGRPFGALVVKEGRVVARAVNRVMSDNDPTAHAELLALRIAGRALGTPRLDGCAVYASGQPCPMCLAAMRLSGITDIAYAHSNADAAPFGLSTEVIAAELARPLENQAWASIRHVPAGRGSRPSLYRLWAERQASG
jgi:tRNA(Arg) A34 adenosine deaminase TadA